MARDNSIPDEDYDRIADFLVDQGYDISKLRRVPHGPKRATHQ